jgi:diguanylate cyclase (GGDEF)-like protein/PAS domain S-box-containing protein
MSVWPIDLISMLSFAAAVVFLLRVPASAFGRIPRIALILALSIYVFVGASNVLEHSGITSSFDPYEDFVEILFLPFFLVFLYSWSMNRELSMRRSAEERLMLFSKALAETKERYERIVQDLPDLVCRYKPDTTITFVNDAYAQYFNQRADDLVGTSFLDLIPQEAHDYVRRSIASFSTKSPVITMEHEAFVPGMGVRWQLWHDRALFDNSGNVTEIQSIGQDITERKAMEQKLHVLSITDELTGLYNRRGFFTVGEQHLKLAKRLGNEILVIVADVDGLKHINDTWGHQEGDLVLVETGRAIRDSFRESDVLARIGGDEFVVLQIVGSGIEPEAVTQRLRQRLCESPLGRDGRYRCEVSVGMVCRMPYDDCSLETMLALADKEMYREKAMKRMESPHDLTP